MIKGLKSLSTLITPKVNRKFFIQGLPFTDNGRCVTCLGAAGGDGLCAPCRDDLPVNRWHCRCCALPLAFPAGDSRSAIHGLLCGECLNDPPPFSRVITPWRYQFPVDAMIRRYKYHGQRSYARPLVTGLCRHLEVHLKAHPQHRPDLLIPSPMHTRRRRLRGFNQAEDITEQVAHHTGLPWSTGVVRRHRLAKPQRELNRDERLANLNGVFQADRAPPARVAIVDDVVTTGATARLLTRTLLEAGAEDVQVWALARTPG